MSDGILTKETISKMRMLGCLTHQCCYGCCRATGPAGRASERRWVKRRERQAWKTAALEEAYRG